MRADADPGAMCEDAPAQRVAEEGWRRWRADGPQIYQPEF